MAEQRIAVVGTGANGAAIAANIHDAGFDVTGFDQWPAHVEAIRANGLTVRTPAGEETVTKLDVHHLCEVAEVKRPFDLDVGAAMAQPLAVAIHALDRVGVGPGLTVAVLGIGGIGGFLIGAASIRGLQRLIAVDVDPAKLALASGLGADEAIDARAADVAATIKEATNGEGVDVVIEASGVPQNPSTAIHATKRGGRVVIVGLRAEPPPVDIFDAALREVDLIATVAHICDSNLPESLAVLAKTELASEVLGDVVPLTRLVEDAIAPLAEGRASGKMVVEVAA
jgi:threonine dehydrogenase-like Zn-dependent dehydrogenase